MSKSAKSKKPPKKNTSKKNRSKTGNAAPTGRLIALEGTRGKDLTDTAERLARHAGRNGDAGWSLWDASNTFYELSLSKAKNPAAPPRTLMLLYASDLMFRLRWEIEPALQAGQTVIAAPYVESAIAMGIALGLSKEWLDELFSFVRKPDTAVRLKEKVKRKNKSKKKDKKKPANSFVEFCCDSLAATSPEWDPVQLREAVLQYLDTLEEKNEICKVGKKLPKDLPASS